MLSFLVYVIATAIIDHFTDHFDAIKQVTIITKDPGCNYPSDKRRTE